MPHCARATFRRRHRHLHPVRRGGAHLRDRLVTPAGPGLRKHHPGRVGHPHGLLRWHGHRGDAWWEDRRPRAVTAAPLRSARDRPRRRRAGHATDVRAAQRGVSGHLSGPRRHAVPGSRAPASRRARAGTGHDHDGRHVPRPRPSFHEIGRPEPGVRPPVLGKHDGSRRGHPHGGPRADRAVRADRCAPSRGDLLRGRRHRRPLACPGRRGRRRDQRGSPPRTNARSTRAGRRCPAPLGSSGCRS